MLNQENTDFLLLQAALRSGLKTLLGWMVPLILTGIGVLVANHYQQAELKREVVLLNHRLSNMTAQLERINEKVIVMWAGGDWSKRYQDAK